MKGVDLPVALSSQERSDAVGEGGGRPLKRHVVGRGPCQGDARVPQQARWGGESRWAPCDNGCANSAAQARKVGVGVEEGHEVAQVGEVACMRRATNTSRGSRPLGRV